jgi:putative ABC transport system permease protein
VEGGVDSEPQAREPDALPPVWVSEAAADLLGFRVGMQIELPLAGRAREFRVAGVWRDYARQHGAVMIELSDYRAMSGDGLTNDVAVRLHKGARPELVANALRAALAEHVIELTSPGEIRAVSLSIFDRTFLITYLMEAVAVLIGLFGISTSYAALATARRKEFGMLRHLGLTRGEVGRLLAMEGAMTASLAVVVGTLAGGAIALVLIEVVNRQSFHWSMDIYIPGFGLIAFAMALIGLAALAARLSGAQAMRRSAVLAVREDW